MDTSGRHRRKRQHKDNESLGNNKRQKVSTEAPKNNTSAGSSKAGGTAQSRLARIRQQQSLDISNISSANSSLDSSLNHSNVAGNVVKFPLSDNRENKSFNFSGGHAKNDEQSKNFHSSTPVHHDSSSKFSKSFKIKSESADASKRGSVSDRLKVHKLLSTTDETSSHRFKDVEHKTPSLSQRLELYSSLDNVCKTPSQRFKIHSSSREVFKTSTPKFNSSTEDEFKTPSPSEKPKVHSSPREILKIDDFKTTSPSQRLKLKNNFRLPKQQSPPKSHSPNGLNIQLFLPSKSVSDRLKMHTATNEIVEGIGLTLKIPSTQSYSEVLRKQSTPLNTSSLNSLKRPDTTSTEFGVKHKTPSERLKLHSIASVCNIESQENDSSAKPNTQSSRFPNFGFMSDKLKSISSFFKSASGRFNTHINEAPPVQKDADLLISSTEKESFCSNLSAGNSFLSHSENNTSSVFSEKCSDSIKKGDETTFESVMLYDDSDIINSSNLSSNAVNSSATSVFSEKGSDLIEKGDETFDCVILDDDIDMDWSPETQEDVVADIRTVRDKISAHNQTSFQDIDRGNSPKTVEEASGVDNKRNLYIIVDTNVFINTLNVLPNILKIEYEDGTFPIVYVPWMVIQELDYFKDGYNVTEKHVGSTVLKNKSMKAIRFINENLISKKPNFVCQPALDATEHQLKILNPDDSILNCCFQVGKHSRVMLLSGDVNLCNKAMINSFEVLRPGDAVETLSSLKKLKHKVDLIEKISEYMSRLCSFIIYSEWKQTGDKQEAARFKQMPWSFPDCIRYMKENYAKVFKPYLQKQTRKIIDDIYNVVILNQDLADEGRFIELVLSLLIFLKTGLSKYEPSIEATIGDIKKLKQTQ